MTFLMVGSFLSSFVAGVVILASFQKFWIDYSDDRVEYRIELVTAMDVKVF